MPQPPLAFGPFTLDPDRRNLARDGVTVELGQRGCELLLALLRAGGQPVSKATLLDQVWPDAMVEEGNLTVQIAQLRKLMGQDAEGRDWIVTVPRVGYRLVLPQTTLAEPADLPRPALAVLPFVNLSGDAAQDYFADGVVEDIITALSRFKCFAVIARSSSFAYRGRAVDVRQVAEDLGVRYVLEGSVRRSADRFRISTQLIECASGRHIWAEHFDGAAQEIFDVQDRIVESVAALVEPTVKRAEIERSRQKRPERLDAYDLYLQALPDVFANRPDAVARAIALLERSVALDPNFAPAAALTGIAYLTRHAMQLAGAVDADRERPLALAAVALKIADDDATVLASCGFIFVHVGGEYETGMALLRRAVAENPNNMNVLTHAGIGALLGGDLGEAAQHLQRALQLNPHEFGTHWQLTGMAHIRMVEGQYEEALDWATRSHAVNRGYDATYWMLIAANAHLGRLDEARRHLAGLQVISPGINLARIRRGQLSKDPHRIGVLIEGMRLAGMPEV